MSGSSSDPVASKPKESPEKETDKESTGNGWAGAAALARAATVDEDDDPGTPGRADPAMEEQEEDQRMLEELLRLNLAGDSVLETWGALNGQGSRQRLPAAGPSCLWQVRSPDLPQDLRMFPPQLPRSRLEQFEDILLESRLLEAALPELSADLTLDFDGECKASNASSGNGVQPWPPLPPQGGDGGEEPEEKFSCDCPNCSDHVKVEQERVEELERLRASWVEVREQVWKVYHLVLNDKWSNNSGEPQAAPQDVGGAADGGGPLCSSGSGSGDVNGSDRPDLVAIRNKVQELCGRDPHQLYQRLEAGIREFVLELKLKLIELLQNQAKNPSLAHEFIKSELHIPSIPRLSCITYQISWHPLGSPQCPGLTACTAY